MTTNFRNAATIVGLAASMITGCSTVASKKTTVPPTKNTSQNTPSPKTSWLMLPYRPYDEYCLIVPRENGDGVPRARLLGVPEELLGDPNDLTTGAGWTTNFDVDLAKYEDPASETTCTDLGYMDASPKISISEDESDNRTLHFTRTSTGGLTQSIHRAITPFYRPDCTPQTECETTPIWYQTEVKNGIQFFVYMTAQQYIGDRYIQNYRVEIFRAPTSMSPQDPNRRCWAERPQYGVTVFSARDGLCDTVVDKENGVGAGNEPR